MRTFVHYIPTGAIKQSYGYHLNCFPDWVWVDLFTKAGFEVTKVSDDLDQVRYEGYKKNPPNCSFPRYDLPDAMSLLGRTWV